VLTLRRNRAYHDEVTLLRDVLDHAQNNARAHSNLGRLLESTDMSEALAHHRQAVALAREQPYIQKIHLAEMRNNLANALISSGKLTEAQAELEDVLNFLAQEHLDDDHELAVVYSVHQNLGAVYRSLGRQTRRLCSSSWPLTRTNIPAPRRTSGPGLLRNWRYR